MEAKDIIHSINKKFPRSVLETQNIRGTCPITVLWVEAAQLSSIVAYFKELDLTCEGTFAYEMDHVIILSYAFVTAESQESSLFLRVSIPIEKNRDEEWIKFSGIGNKWSGILATEEEIGDLFGIAFNEGQKRVLLPQEWVGFPLRKQYVFPMEFGGVPHSRPLGQTEPDEHGEAP